MKPITRNRYGPSSNSHPKGNRDSGFIEGLHNSIQNLFPKERHLNGRTFFQFTLPSYLQTRTPHDGQNRNMPPGLKCFCSILNIRDKASNFGHYEILVIRGDAV